jgi:hypothetical protein
MSNKADSQITFAADELLGRFGARAAIQAAEWANDAYNRGDFGTYDFWQMVVMDLNERGYQKNRVKWRSH